MTPGHRSASTAPNHASSLADLLSRPAADQAAQGYTYTVAEIAQQPDTWLDTARSAARLRDVIRRQLARGGVKGPGSPGAVYLTGSGSSLYVGECVARPLTHALGVPVIAVSSGDLLTDLDGWLPLDRPGVLVSFARSGDSPESTAAVDEVLAARPRIEHLVITCNGNGRLASRYAAHSQVEVLVLDARTCDRSLVMTSSFTNMVVAAACLGSLDDPSGYIDRVARLATAGRAVLDASDVVARAAQLGYEAAVFLGTGSRFGAARECALKSLEMTGGRVAVTAESFLGLRHGPMSGVHPETLVGCLLSSDPVTRAYEIDLLRELQAKGLGVRLVVGERLPREALAAATHAIDLAESLDDAGAAVIGVVIGQLLGLFRCLSLGLQPDEPSATHVISRVVGEFAIHRRYAPAAPRS